MAQSVRGTASVGAAGLVPTAVRGGSARLHCPAEPQRAPLDGSGWPFVFVEAEAEVGADFVRAGIGQRDRESEGMAETMANASTRERCRVLRDGAARIR